MQYVEILRGRRVLLWYIGALCAAMIVAVVCTYSFASHGTINSGTPMPFSGLVVGCAIGAWIIATCVAPGLSAEHGMAAIVWTRPLRRDTIAWRYVGVDLVTIVLGYVALIAVLVLSLAAFGAAQDIVFDAASAGGFLLGLGTAVMWYGLVQVVAARVPSRGGLVAGLSWVVFIVLTVLWATRTPPAVHALATVANYINPMAWIGSSSSHGSTSHIIIMLPTALRALGTWAIGAVTTIAGVRLWATREV